MKWFLFIFVLLSQIYAANLRETVYPPEKYQPAAHIGASGVIVGVSYYSLKYLSGNKKDSYIASILLSVGTGLWKEIWDMGINKNFNLTDMGYNGIGIFSVSISIYFEDFLWN